jgi:outer membrane protein assembly factor BamD (BamD/ComL family)
MRSFSFLEILIIIQTRLISDYPQSKFAKKAQERMDEIEKKKDAQKI